MVRPRRCADRVCSQVLAATLRAGTLYCSPACRQRAYRRSQRSKIADRRARRIDLQCDFCDRYRSAERRDARGETRLVRVDNTYCSARCRQRAYRMRLLGKAIREATGIGVPARRRAATPARPVRTLSP